MRNLDEMSTETGHERAGANASAGESASERARTSKSGSLSSGSNGSSSSGRNGSLQIDTDMASRASDEQESDDIQRLLQKIELSNHKSRQGYQELVSSWSDYNDQQAEIDAHTELLLSRNKQIANQKKELEALLKELKQKKSEAAMPNAVTGNPSIAASLNAGGGSGASHSGSANFGGGSGASHTGSSNSGGASAGNGDVSSADPWALIADSEDFRSLLSLERNLTSRLDEHLKSQAQRCNLAEIKQKMDNQLLLKQQEKDSLKSILDEYGLSLRKLGNLGRELERQKLRQNMKLGGQRGASLNPLAAIPVRTTLSQPPLSPHLQLPALRSFSVWLVFLQIRRCGLSSL